MYIGFIIIINLFVPFEGKLLQSLILFRESVENW